MKVKDRPERVAPGMAARAAGELARGRRRVRHRATMARLRTMARAGGRPAVLVPARPRRQVNSLPESLPLEAKRADLRAVIVLAVGRAQTAPGEDDVYLTAERLLRRRYGRRSPCPT